MFIVSQHCHCERRVNGLAFHQSPEAHSKEFAMKWTKPVFELVELCSEVTSYFYHR
jgi:hypothetical protein